MMPPSATIEDIKAYRQRMEKGQITAQNLPPCPRCALDATHFRIHAYRERRFLLIVDMFVQSVFCALVRFVCLGCGKTFTSYPDFAIPHKHYTRQSIMGFAKAYLETEEMTYQRAVMLYKCLAAYIDSERSLAPSTLHRWISSLGRMVKTTQAALSLVRQANPASNAFRLLAQWTVPSRKYRSQARRECLLSCFRLLLGEALFGATFNVSIFTNLATRCAFC